MLRVDKEILAMRCPKCSYEWTPSIKSAAKTLGAIKSDAKANASRRNGRLGGRGRTKEKRNTETYLTCTVCGGPTGQPSRICSSKCENKSRQQTSNLKEQHK